MIKKNTFSISIFKLAALFIIFYCCISISFGQNLLVNGDFESGGSGVGFQTPSPYNFIGTPPALSGNSSPNDYAIIPNPFPMNTANFIAGSDHSGTGKMMVVDATTNGGQQRFWKAGNSGGGVGPLTPGLTYTFSYWIKNVSSSSINAATTADIGVSWNNASSITLVSGSTQVSFPGSTAVWQKVTYSFVPTSSYVNIELYDNNTSAAGNDFAIDDLEVLPPAIPLSLKYAVVNPTCPIGNDGFIAVYGVGGTPPYTYSFNGGTFGVNNIFQNIGPSTGNTVAVKDAAIPLAGSVSSSGINIVAPVNPLVVRTDTSICTGASVTLSVSGSASGYTWTATPSDATLTAPNSPNPTVSPSTTTVYIVSSTIATTQNLIYNGDFSQGNVGFSSDYTYFSVNTGLVQSAYGIVTNPNTFEPGFSASCKDHTTTTGNMFVADGATNITRKVWCQTVPVAPSTTYTFTYYLQTVATPNPAIIETQINGIPITGLPATSSLTAPSVNCGWVQGTYTWNSGLNTSAQICLYNRNNSTAGNDFTLDDITFTRSTSCLVQKSVTITVGSLAVPTINIIQPTCSVATGTINVTAPLTGVTYSFDNGASFQLSPNSPSLPANATYQVIVKNAAGCLSNAIPAIINPQPANPAAPTASATVQPTCTTPTGTITVTAPTGVNLLYSKDGITYQAGLTFTGLAAATYPISVKDNSTGCISANTNITINAVPANPAAPTASATVQPTCITPTGTITVTAPTGVNLLYSKDGITYQAGLAFAGLAAATYPISVKDNSTGCISSSTNITINAVPGNPAAPTASATIQPTCTTPTGTITVTAPTGVNLLYSKDGITYQAGLSFTGLAPATYPISVKDNNTGCISSSTNITINAVPANPSVPTASATTQTTCTTPTGTITVTAPTGANLLYSKDGVTYQAGLTFTGLAAATYPISVKDNSTGCISANTNITINAVPATPAAPTASATVQPTCITPTGTITVTAPTGVNLLYSKDGITYQAGLAFAGLAAATYPISVKDNSTGCISSSTNITINAVPGNPAAPSASATVQPTCTITTGTITVTAPTGVNLLYSKDGITYQAGLAFAGLSAATYPISVKNNSTGCISSSTNITINAVPANPAAPTASATVQPTCTTPTGTIAVTAPTGANLLYSKDGVTFQSGLSFAGLAPATYPITVKDNSTGCISSSTNITINAVPGNPVAPTASATLQPTCTTPTGTISVTAPTGANLLYSKDGVTYQASLTFTGLAAATYPISVKDNSTGCISSNTNITINAVPGNPAAPTATATTQPTCTTPTGTITVTAPTGANLLYSKDGITYQAGLAFAGLSAATYPISVKNNSTGCISSSTNITINVVPANPAAPTATATAQPTCTIPTGTITISAPTGVNLLYSKDGITYQAGLSFAGLAAATYPINVKDNSTGCISSSTNITINAVPSNPAAPTASATVQPTCTTATGTITVTAPTGANLLYSKDGITYQAGLSFAGLAAATYPISVKDNSTGCISFNTNITINAVPANPAAPIASATVQPTCTTPTGTITVTAPTGANLLYSKDGITFQAGLSFAGLAAATYPITVKDNSTGCISSSTNITINAVPGLPAAPNATDTVTYCQGATAIPLNAIGANLNWYQTETGGSGSAVAPIPVVLIAGITTYYVSQTIGGCEGPRDSVKVLVKAGPQLGQDQTKSICNNGSFNLTQAFNTNGLTVTYSLNGTPGVTPAAVTIAGTYMIKAINNQGCEDSASLNLTVQPIITAFAGNDSFAIANQPFQLLGSGNPSVASYTWTAISPVSNSIFSNRFIANPTITLSGNTYILELEVKDAIGCSAKDLVTINVLGYKEYFMPTAFSPNGDILNDVFRPLPSAQTLFDSFRIYNRFGELIFETSNRQSGWDGTYKGKPQLPGNYIWVLQRKYANGNVVTTKGNVVLIR